MRRLRMEWIEEWTKRNRIQEKMPIDVKHNFLKIVDIREAMKGPPRRSRRK